MKNVKKYIIGFIVGLSLVGSIGYASNNGTIGSLFDNVGTSHPTLSGANITNGTISANKLDFTIPTTVAELTDSGNYYTKDEMNSFFNCTFNGTTVLNGAGVTAYSSSSVPYGSSCTSQTRTCNNGTLSGTYGNSSCSVGSLANANDCSTIGGYCKGGKYLGNHLIVQTSDLGTYNWNNAKTACNNSTVGGQNDWLLPSKTQLSTLYQLKNIIGVYSSRLEYCSSTEIYNSNFERVQYFYDGDQYYGKKNNNFNVRCIRTF